MKIQAMIVETTLSYDYEKKGPIYWVEFNPPNVRLCMSADDFREFAGRVGQYVTIEIKVVAP